LLQPAAGDATLDLGPSHEWRLLFALRVDQTLRGEDAGDQAGERRPVPRGPQAGHLLLEGDRAERLAAVLLLRPGDHVALQVGERERLKREALAERPLEVGEVRLDGGEAVRLHRALPVRLDVALAERLELRLGRGDRLLGLR